MKQVVRLVSDWPSRTRPTRLELAKGLRSAIVPKLGTPVNLFSRVAIVPWERTGLRLNALAMDCAQSACPSHGIPTSAPGFSRGPAGAFVPLKSPPVQQTRWYSEPEKLVNCQARTRQPGWPVPR